MENIPKNSLINNIWFWRILAITLIIIIIIHIENICKNITDDLDNTLNHDLSRHLFYLTNKFTKYNIKYWLMYGTLLGAVRLKRFIKSDPDIDIGVNINDYDKIMALNDIIKYDGYYMKKMYTYGIDVKNQTDKLIWRVSLKISYNGTNIGDIIFFREFNDGIMRRYDINEDINYFPSQSTFPAWYIEKLDTIKLDNKIYNVPQNYETLLEYWYGNKWKTMRLTDDIDSPDYEYDDINKGKRNLSFLINHVHEYDRNYMVTPSKNNAKYTFPENQINWMNKNDPIIKI
jgi:phosphorylcholine metabolism protein LicD